MAKKPQISVQRDLAKDLAAAQVLKAQLAEMFGEQADADLLRDSIDGETNLFETIDRALAQIAADEANIEGIKKFATTIAARRTRLENRCEALRTILLNVLDMLGERKFERPIATLSMKEVPPALVVTDEASIPAQFWRRPDPVLDKAALTTWLKSIRADFAAKLDEITARLNAGEIDDAKATEDRAAVLAVFPTIPGAELSNGGTSVQIRWS